MRVISKINKTFLHRWLPSILLFMFYILEGYGKIVEKSGTDKSDVAKWFKLFVMTGIIISLWKYWKKTIWIVILFLIFIIGQSTLSEGFNEQVIINFAKHIFPIIIFFFFTKFFDDGGDKKILFQSLTGLLLFNSILVVIGYIFDIHWFYAYKWGRFGFNGLLLTSSLATYVYIIGLFILLLWYKEKFFKQISTYFLLIATILLGTKGGVLGLFSVFTAYFIFCNPKTRKYKKQIIIASSGIALLLFYIFFFQIGLFNEIRKDEGLLTSILSLRNELITDEMIPFIQKEWKWSNYLFGGYSDIETRSQMGFVDIFYFWGVFGGLFYFFVYFQSFISFQINTIIIWVLSTLMIIVFLAGNYFENASLIIYLVILREIFKTSVPPLQQFQNE